MRTRPERDPQQCIYSIPCECGRRYIGETHRPLAMRLHKHRHNLKEGLLKKSELAQHAYEVHMVGWNEARILEIENNSRYRKYKDSGHVVCLTNPTIQSNFDVSPMWIPLPAMKLATYREGKVVGIYIILVLGFHFRFTDGASSRCVL
jgi:predicted GIY-YIG superfamily endonuclease